ncbi:MAG TPA: MerR family transcriptional regulator [Gaiellaceae bacterium]|nr:MerR family transcriptional regulator [Gaiellaceae bacterium]
MEDLMPIGEFATASRLSQKALRLYAEKGLLPPAWVDPASGYRYYRPEQLRAATLIALLRRAAVPLVEIRAFLREPSVGYLDDYERRMLAEFAERRRVLRGVKRVLKEEPMYEVVTKHVEEQPYVSREKRVYVSELDRFIADTFAELRSADADAPPFVLYHGPVNHEEDGPVEVCVPRRAGEKRLAAGEVAFTAISGAQCDFPEILGAYESVYRWAKEHRREPAGPPREVYVNLIGEPLRMEIALPLR